MPKRIETPNQKKLRIRRAKLAAYDAKIEKQIASRRAKGFNSETGRKKGKR